MPDIPGLDEFATGFRGELIQPGDDHYDEARKIYNAMIDKRPRLIARCADVADVIESVRFAKKSGLTAAIRGGGHNGPGLALCNDGLVIDLSAMKGVHVDPAGRTARVQPGCTWGDVDHATHAFGLAVPSGVISTTGVGGLTLGGGHGYLTRKYGLTIDNLLAADVVLADGRLVQANSETNPDLFWAIRGGGGNFGVVTSFLYQLQPVDTVYAGPTLYPLEKAPDVLRWYRDFIRKAPEDLYGFFAMMVVPPAPPFPEELHNKKMCGIVWCYAGSAEKADKALSEVQRFGPPVFSHLGPVPFPMLQSLFDGLYPPGLQWYWKGHFIKEIPDEAIQAHIEHASKIPTMQSTMHLYPINGAVHRVKEADTAFSYREANWSMVLVGVDGDPANNSKITKWVRDYWEAIKPYSLGGSYVNFMMEEGDEPIRAAYRKNYKRLAEVKRKYDPDNFFCVNQNILPAAA